MPRARNNDRSERAVRLYQDGLTLRQVAAAVGCHLQTVRGWCKDAGVPMRPPYVRY